MSDNINKLRETRHYCKDFAKTWKHWRRENPLALKSSDRWAKILNVCQQFPYCGKKFAYFREKYASNNCSLDSLTLDCSQCFLHVKKLNLISTKSMCENHFGHYFFDCFKVKGKWRKSCNYFIFELFFDGKHLARIILHQLMPSISEFQTKQTNKRNAKIICCFNSLFGRKSIVFEFEQF